jgi:hypothetical protein
MLLSLAMVLTNKLHRSQVTGTSNHRRLHMIMEITSGRLLLPQAFLLPGTGFDLYCTLKEEVEKFLLQHLHGMVLRTFL